MKDAFKITFILFAGIFLSAAPYLPANPTTQAMLAAVAKKRGAGGGGSTLRTDLVAWWALEETTTADRVDSHTNGYDLTASGSIASGTGKIGNGCDFEAADSRMLSRTDAGLAAWVKGGTNPLSINFWFKAETRSGALLSQGSELFINAGASTNLQIVMNSFTTNDRVSSAASSWLSATWQMWTFIYDGTDIRIHIDGNTTPSASITPTGTWADDTNDLLIGRWSVNYCDGIMDELAIWNKALSNDELGELYNSNTGIGYADTAP